MALVLANVFGMISGTVIMFFVAGVLNSALFDGLPSRGYLLIPFIFGWAVALLVTRPRCSTATVLERGLLLGAIECGLAFPVVLVILLRNISKLEMITSAHLLGNVLGGLIVGGGATLLGVGVFAGLRSIVRRAVVRTQQPDTPMEASSGGDVFLEPVDRRNNGPCMMTLVSANVFGMISGTVIMFFVSVTLHSAFFEGLPSRGYLLTSFIFGWAVALLVTKPYRSTTAEVLDRGLLLGAIEWGLAFQVAYVIVLVSELKMVTGVNLTQYVLGGLIIGSAVTLLGVGLFAGLRFVIRRAVNRTQQPYPPMQARGAVAD